MSLWKNMPDLVIASLTFGYALVAILHICGLTMLCWLKFSPVNQRTILINLAISELGVALTLTVVYPLVLVDSCNKWCYLTDVFFVTFFTVTNKMLMIYLICDRMLEINLNIRYPLYFTEDNVRKIIMGLWMISGGYALIMVLFIRFDVVQIRVRKTIVTSVLVIQDSIIIVTAATTYAFLYRKVKNMLTGPNIQCQVQNSSSETPSSKFLLPSLIVASYIFLNLAGDIMFFLSHDLE